MTCSGSAVDQLTCVKCITSEASCGNKESPVCSVYTGVSLLSVQCCYDVLVGLPCAVFSIRTMACLHGLVSEAQLEPLETKLVGNWNLMLDIVLTLLLFLGVDILTVNPEYVVREKF